MRTIKMLRACAVAAAALLGLQGCGALLTPSTLVSMGVSLIGGVANGAVMGGSVLGVIRDNAAGAGTGSEAASASTPSQVAPIAGNNEQPVVSSAPERICHSPNASDLGVPCS